MKLDGPHGFSLRAFLRALFALAEPPEPKPPADATVVLVVHPPQRK